MQTILKYNKVPINQRYVRINMYVIPHSFAFNRNNILVT